MHSTCDFRMNESGKIAAGPEIRTGIRLESRPPAGVGNNSKQRKTKGVVTKKNSRPTKIRKKSISGVIRLCCSRFSDRLNREGCKAITSYFSRRSSCSANAISAKERFPLDAPSTAVKRKRLAVQGSDGKLERSSCTEIPIC
nr:hypothetical protein [Crucivirus sp.]